MAETLRKLLKPLRQNTGPAVPRGQRVYAIGDIHGRLDLFAALANAIEADDAARGSAETTVILLGDLIDRSPDSASVVAAARAWQYRRKVRILCGNHEEMFLQSFRSLEVLGHFLRYGGYETVVSYPVDIDSFSIATPEQARDMMIRAIPQDDIDFLSNLEDLVVIGDYVFVHAGIDPEVPLEHQTTQHMHWIREPFLSHRGDFGHVVVHGHTIKEEPVVRQNRIGIDTGAFATGRLTALCLEETRRWVIEARAEGNTIKTGSRPI